MNENDPNATLALIDLVISILALALSLIPQFFPTRQGIRRRVRIASSVVVFVIVLFLGEQAVAIAVGPRSLPQNPIVAAIEALPDRFGEVLEDIFTRWFGPEISQRQPTETPTATTTAVTPTSANPATRAALPTSTPTDSPTHPIPGPMLPFSPQASGVVGNIITCLPPNPPNNTWIWIYRLDGNEKWVKWSKNLTSIEPSGYKKIDGLPVDGVRFGQKGEPYKIEVLQDGVIIASTGDKYNGEEWFHVRPNADNYTPWSCSNW